jgi:hypothetical protein
MPLVTDMYDEPDLRKVAAAYRESVSDQTDYKAYSFELGYQWQDKPHRHVYDLCKRLEAAADEIARLKAALATP